MNVLSPKMAPIATVLDPAERAEVDRAGAGLYRALHRESVHEVLDDLRVRRVSAVVMSTSRCSGDPKTMRVVREFPGIPALVLLTRRGATAPADVLAMGNCGVRHVVDVRMPGGWADLRHTLEATMTLDREAVAAREVLAEIGVCDRDMARFIGALFSGPASPRTVQQLARSLGVLSSTMVSRFYRAGVPAPKQYLALAGIVRAAWLLENPGFSIADAAHHLGHSSPQSFARHLRIYTGLSGGAFRRAYDGDAMLRKFRADLITPYRERLGRLSPVIVPGRRSPPEPRAA